MEPLGLFVSSGASSAAVHEGVRFLRRRELVSPDTAKYLEAWLPPAFNLLLLLGMKRRLLNWLGLHS
jgi:hypothetical protein